MLGVTECMAGSIVVFWEFTLKLINSTLQPEMSSPNRVVELELSVRVISVGSPVQETFASNPSIDEFS